MQKPTILITNDDGYQAKGLKKLASLMRTIGNVTVVSTEKVMSAQGHSITMREPLTVRQTAAEEGYLEFVCNGTPVDCVKLGYQCGLSPVPDIIVSGINHGTNASVNLVYSGTMAAVVEACMDGYPAIGFSLNCYDADADFDHLDPYIIAITRKVLAEGLPKGISLNVNFPKRCEEPIRGIRVCRQARGQWTEQYASTKNPDGTISFQICSGAFLCDDNEDNDVTAVANNFVSIQPVQFDWTAYHQIAKMKSYELIHIL